MQSFMNWCKHGQLFGCLCKFCGSVASHASSLACISALRMPLK